jgi:hypothetical protein
MKIKRIKAYDKVKNETVIKLKNKTYNEVKK